MNPVVKTIERHKQANKSIKATTGKMSKIYMDARERLNEKLQRYVLSHANPAYGTWFVELINELERNYAKLEEKFVEEMGRAIPYVAESYYREALNDIGKSIIGKLDKAKIELFRKDAFTHIAGMTTNMQKSDVAWLRQTAADVFRLAGVGGMTAQETKQMMLAKILMRPEKFQFTDVGGRMWDNKTYCEMLARTVLLNAGRQTYFDTCAENGNDVVRVTVSGNACPACAVWENRLLSISGATPGLPTVEEATNAGLCHPNCTHSFVAVPDYVRGEDFTKNGRPKKGLNSPDNVIKDDKEAWKKYRDSLKPKKREISDSDGRKAKSGNVTPENKKVGSKSLKTANKGIPEIEQPELPKNKYGRTDEYRIRRQKQWDEAYENRRKKWYQSIIDAGGSKELAEELTKAYTPEAAKVGKPPKVALGTSTSRTGLSKDGTKLIIRDGVSIAEIKKKIGNFAHRLKRGKQVKIARYNRTKREAEMIGADLIKGPHSRKADLKAVNPNYVPDRDGVWENNCQRCVVAYEARLRGINVVAKPCVMPLSKDYILQDHWQELCGKNAKWAFMNERTAEKRIETIETQMKKWGEGSRATIYVKWGDKKGAHVFCAELKNGKVVFVDPQTGEKNVERYFSQQKSNRSVTFIDSYSVTSTV